MKVSLLFLSMCARGRALWGQTGHRQARKSLHQSWILLEPWSWTFQPPGWWENKLLLFNHVVSGILLMAAWAKTRAIWPSESESLWSRDIRMCPSQYNGIISSSTCEFILQYLNLYSNISDTKSFSSQGYLPRCTYGIQLRGNTEKQLSLKPLKSDYLS